MGNSASARNEIQPPLETPKKVVLVFGETGKGKSSLVNMIMGRERAKISSSAQGCTFQHEVYSNETYDVYDTVGLSEGSQGTVKSEDAICALIDLVQSLGSGIHCLIFVTNRSRITQTMEENYRLFVEVICCNKVPVITVFTHCENDVDVNKWYNENKWSFEAAGICPTAVVSGCCTMGDSNTRPEVNAIYRNAYEATKKDVINALENIPLSTPWVCNDSLMTRFGSILTYLCILVGITFQSPLNSLKEILTRLGHSPPAIAKILKKFVFKS